MDEFEYIIEKAIQVGTDNIEESWLFYEAIGDLDGMHKIAFPNCSVPKAHCHGDYK